MVADKLPPGAPRMRQCTLKKKHADQEYGFNLHAEKERGNFIGHIDDGGPADVAGLHVGDHIVAVNKNDIKGTPHHQVVQFIKTDPLSCELLVIDEEGLHWYAERQLHPSATMVDQIDVVLATHSHHHGTQSSTNAPETLPEPAVEQTNGHHENVAENPVAAAIIANPPPTYTDLYTVEHHNPVADVIAANQPRDAVDPPFNPVADAIARNPPKEVADHQHHEIDVAVVANPVAVAVEQNQPPVAVEEEPEPTSPEPSIPINVIMATPPQEQQLKPKLCTLVKKTPNEDYGFNLHAEKDKGHFIGTIDSNSVAEHAGLQMRQRIVGINGSLIYPTSRHSDVVDLIRADPQKVELLVVTPEVDSFYRERRMSFAFDDHAGKSAVARLPASPSVREENEDEPEPVAVTPPAAPTPPKAATPPPTPQRAATPPPPTPPREVTPPPYTPLRAATPPPPVESTPAPVESTPTPVESTPAPVESTPAPVESTPAPVESTPAPVESTPAPVEFTPAPVESTPAPVESTPAPVESTPSASVPEPEQEPEVVVPVVVVAEEKKEESAAATTTAEKVVDNNSNQSNSNQSNSNKNSRANSDSTSSQPSQTSYTVGQMVRVVMIGYGVGDRYEQQQQQQQHSNSLD